MNKNNSASKQKKQPGKKKPNDSVTEKILRSQITLNPYNPKRHTEKQVKQQVDNIRRNGYLGGIVWNRTSGKLVDGHRRVQALDIIHKYDGTPEKDYTLKVEVVEFDEKTELEQMTYMAVGNSKADYNLIADYMDGIDMSCVGLSDEEMAAYLDIFNTRVPVPDTAAPAITDMSGDFITPRYELDAPEESFEQIAEKRESAQHASKEEIKSKKSSAQQVSNDYVDDLSQYIMLQFKNSDDMQAFADATGLNIHGTMIMDGMEFLDAVGL